MTLFNTGSFSDPLVVGVHDLDEVIICHGMWRYGQPRANNY
jgi:hypothetical protein